MRIERDSSLAMNNRNAIDLQRELALRLIRFQEIDFDFIDEFSADGARGCAHQAISRMFVLSSPGVDVPIELKRICPNSQELQAHIYNVSSVDHPEQSAANLLKPFARSDLSHSEVLD